MCCAEALSASPCPRLSSHLTDWLLFVVSQPLILGKSASIRGFFLSDYTHKFAEHVERLTKMIQAGKLQVVVDKTPFTGLEAIPDAIDHLYKGGNTGKVVVKVGDATQSSKL